MRRLTGLALCLAAAAVTAGCPKSMTHTITLKAGLNEAGSLYIDYRQHDEATLKHRDRLRWTCDCPEGATFAVRNIHALAIGPLTAAETKAKVEAAGTGDAIAEIPYDPGDPFLGETPEKGFAGDQAILSEPYRQFDDDILWKFDWVVNLDGHREQVWDPHFAGHKKR